MFQIKVIIKNDKFFKIKSNLIIFFFQVKILQDNTGTIYCLASLDNGFLLSGSKTNSIKIWNINDGYEVDRILAHKDAITCLTILNNEMIASASLDKEIKIWNISKKSPHMTLKGHSDYVSCLAYLKEDDLLASGSWDTKIFIWNYKTGQHNIIEDTEKIKSLVYLNDKKIASCSESKKIKIFNYLDINSSEIIILTGHKNIVNCLCSLNKKDWLISGDQDGSIKIWNYKTSKKEIFTLEGHKDSVRCIISLNEEEKNLIASSSNDGQIKIWNLNKPYNHLGININYFILKSIKLI